MSQTLSDTAKALVVDGKGILAADESSPTIKKRFEESLAISGRAQGRIAL